MRARLGASAERGPRESSPTAAGADRRFLAALQTSGAPRPIRSPPTGETSQVRAASSRASGRALGAVRRDRSLALPGRAAAARVSAAAASARHLSAVRGLYRFLLEAGRDAARSRPSTSTARARPRGCRARSPWRTRPRSSRRPTRRARTGSGTAPCSSCSTRPGSAPPSASALRLEDVNFAAGYVIVTGKGNRQRLVPAGAQALDWVRRYARHVAPAPRQRRDARRPLPQSLGRRPVAAGALGHDQARGEAGGPPQPRSRRTPCATPSRAISSSAARTCARCRPCSATSTSRPRRSTRTCRRASVHDMYRKFHPAARVPVAARG